MRDGFVQVAALTPAVRVADVEYNVDACVAAVRGACAPASDPVGTGHGSGEGGAPGPAQVVTLPELCLTAYTCEDLFWQDALLDAAEAGLARFASETAEVDALVVVGVPLRVSAKLYNCAAVLSRGRIIGVVPKRHIPTYGEFYEGRHFRPGPADATSARLAGQDAPFGARQLFRCRQLPDLVVGVELCEDLWVPDPPSTALAQAGATLVCNLSASDELVGKADYRRSLVSSTSARLVCAYAYASSGWGESSQDLVFGGHDLICEDGRLLRETTPLVGGVPAPGAEDAHATTGVSTVIDVGLLASERRRMSTFETSPDMGGCVVSEFDLDVRETSLALRAVDPHPFVPADRDRRAERCESILAIQARGLAKRLSHTRSRRAVVGVSGGLDSTLALLVCARALDLLGLPRSGALALTMPGFGTTGRTHDNARALADALGCELREVDISAAVRQHFSDIGHDEQDLDVTYENAQARERTQVLMDVANQEAGLVVGTGDLSELTLGWATYNADHMSMYGVNAGVPKTLVRHLVRYAADEAAAFARPGVAGTGGGATPSGEAAARALASVLADVLDTPVSPELLPADGDDVVSQRTEDLVGPYELHDFFLYNVVRRGFAPRKVYRLALAAFGGRRGGCESSLTSGTYDDATILRWLKVFYRRFFAQQFKRSCLPDGPKVGSVAVSPRGDLRMPSDACRVLWQRELDEL